MKKIKIKHFHKIPLMVSLIFPIGILLSVIFLISGISSSDGILTAIGLIPIISLAIALPFFFNYGITITDKKVTLISQHMLKRFDYEDISYIKVVFKKHVIAGEVKTLDQKIFAFSFDGIDLSTSRSLFPRLYISGLNLSKKFVDRNISELSRCEKVKVLNLYMED